MKLQTPDIFRTCYRHRYILLMILPPLLLILLFCYVPMYGAVIAFKNFKMSDGIFGSEWTGLETFRRLFLGPDFLRVLGNTLVISILKLLVGFVAPIALALMLNEVRLRRYKLFVQTLSYLPCFFSWIILGGILKLLLSPGGPVNSLLVSMNINSIPFLTNNTWFVVTLIASAVWQGVGYGAVIYLAALSGISPTLYEAAMVDGAGRWRQTLHITLPCLVPTMIVLFILSLGGILNAGFDQIFNLYSPVVYQGADIIDTYVLRQMIAMDFSVATAAGLFKAVVGMVLIVGANSVANRVTRGEQGLW
ncbi:MAG: ABC transporter permease subunit [bacterium]